MEDWESWIRMVEQGFRLISLGGDRTFLVETVAKVVKNARSVLDTPKTKK